MATTASAYTNGNTNGALIDPTTQKTEPAYDLMINELDHLMEYRSNTNGLSNSAVSKVDLLAGSHFCYITTHIPCPETTWSSVQTGREHHIEFTSALVYMNHSCSPTLEFHVYEPDNHGQYPSSVPRDERSPAAVGGKYGIAGQVRVVGNRDLKKGDDLTWFYPSTEYLSPRPFECVCGAPEELCIGMQRGAHYLSDDLLSRYHINKHIKDLGAEQRHKSPQ